MNPFDKTFNPWKETDSGRPIAAEAYWKQPERWNREAEAAGVRRRVFCASMADVFEAHDTMPAESFKETAMARIRLLALIASTPNLDWQLLTKRPKYARFILGMPETWNEVNQELFRRCRPVLPGTANCYATGRRVLENVWMGTSVETQKEADERIPALLKIPAKVRFLSCEPLIGPVRLDRVGGDQFGHHSFNALAGGSNVYLGPDGEGRAEFEIESPCAEDAIHWVICGGESGHGARPMHPDWARSLRDQCAAAGVPFFFKQWGEWLPWANFTELDAQRSGVTRDWYLREKPGVKDDTPIFLYEFKVLDCENDKHDLEYDPFGDEGDGCSGWICRQCKKQFGELNMPMSEWKPMTAEAWNAKYPEPIPVRYWPMEREGEGIVSRTRSEAWNLGSGHPVVKVEGKAGGIHLTHVDPIRVAAK